MNVLKQFICDVCGKVIEKPEDGYVVWKDNSALQQYGFLILHKNNRNEDGDRIGCDNDKSYGLSSELPRFLGVEGLAYLLSFIDPGSYHMPKYKQSVNNMREFIEFFRRVQLPYYEEARLYWDKALHDGYFYQASESWMYSSSTLQTLINKYKNKP